MLLTVVLLWSGNFTAMRYGVESFHPLAFSAVRFGLGAALYALVVLGRERSLRIARRDFGAILLLAGVGIFANQVAVIYAVQKAGAANVGMLMASAPIIAALLARRLGHERIGPRHVVGIAVAATGALLVLYGGGGIGGAPLIGWLLGLVTAATWASYSVLLRPLMARYSAERLSAAVLLTGSAMLIPVSLPQLAEQDWGAPNGNAWLALGYSLVFSLLVTNVLWFDAIHRVGAARATIFLYLEPFCVALIAMAVLGEHVSPAEWVGGVVILGGVLVARRGEREWTAIRGPATAQRSHGAVHVTAAGIGSRAREGAGVQDRRLDGRARVAVACGLASLPAVHECPAAGIFFGAWACLLAGASVIAVDVPAGPRTRRAARCAALLALPSVVVLVLLVLGLASPSGE